MSASDGYVGDTVKIVDHGPNGSRWDLVVVGDGYRASELAKYHTDVQHFIDRMYNTPPYDELWCGINVHRIDVVSTDSGADDPMVAGSCPTGTGATPNTYFDSKFCSDWQGSRLDRLLTIDSGLAQSVAAAKVSSVDQIICIVNSSKYGGSGGAVATCSTEARAAEIAIHEIGHSAFKLADEYGGAGATASGPEPPQPNVTFDPNRATNKWRDLVAATTPMPSACNPGCTAGCVAPATPPAAGAVGAYEGAVYVDCGAYRPLPDCYMRNYAPFCPVCTRVIRQKLAPFLPPESVSLVTPSLSFTDIPEGIGTGVTTYRAIVFEVTACRRLHFAVVSGPTGGFGLPLGSTAEGRSDEYAPTGKARLWISYTSGTAGSTSSGTVRVRLNETGQTWDINLQANTVARPKAAVSLVLDHSGSMSEDAGDGLTKVAKLREAAGIFIGAMLPGDGIGLVRFDDTAQRIMDVTDVGALTGGAGRVAAINHINGSEFDPAGATSIGAGVTQSRDQLNAASASPPYAVRAMIVLTDGVENTAPMLSAVSASINANTFAIGLGVPYNISVAALDTLTQGTGGYLVVTGTLTPDQRTRLTKYFLQALAGITNANVITDPPGTLVPGAEHRVPFDVCEADYGVDAFLLTPAPGAVDYQLETPGGIRIDMGSAAGLGTAEAVVRQGVAFYRVALPAIPKKASGTHAGRWHAVLKLKREGSKRLAASSNAQLSYWFAAHAYSSLTFKAWVVQKSYFTGEPIRIYAALKEYEVPVDANRATVWAEIERPDGAIFNLRLRALDDLFAATFNSALPGLYTLRIRAAGETMHGARFTREQTLTAVALIGGGRVPVIPPCEPIWCKLSRALFRSRSDR